MPAAELGTASARITIGPGGVRVGERCERIRTCREVGGGERRVCRTEINRRGERIEVCTVERRCR